MCLIGCLLPFPLLKLSLPFLALEKRLYLRERDTGLGENLIVLVGRRVSFSLNHGQPVPHIIGKQNVVGAPTRFEPVLLQRLLQRGFVCCYSTGRKQYSVLN